MVLSSTDSPSDQTTNNTNNYYKYQQDDSSGGEKTSSRWTYFGIHVLFQALRLAGDCGRLICAKCRWRALMRFKYFSTTVPTPRTVPTLRLDFRDNNKPLWLVSFLESPMAIGNSQYHRPVFFRFFQPLCWLMVTVVGPVFFISKCLHHANMEEKTTVVACLLGYNPLICNPVSVLSVMDY